MAAPRVRCACCGEPWDRRAVNQAYCPKPACQRAHNADRLREWRRATAYREDARHRAAIERTGSGQVRA